MSIRIHIYGLKGEEYIQIMSYSDSDGTYRAITENLNVPYVDNGYAKITSTELDDAILGLSITETKLRKQRAIAVECCDANKVESIDNELEELKNTEVELYGLHRIKTTGHFEGIYCNIY